jgi:hypothetical protein
MEPPGRDVVNKKDLLERDICTKYVTPALTPATRLPPRIYLDEGYDYVDCEDEAGERAQPRLGFQPQP